MQKTIRHSHSNRTPRVWLRGIGIALLAVTVFLISGATFAYQHLQANVNVQSVDDLLDREDRPARSSTDNSPEQDAEEALTAPSEPFDGDSFTLLLMGSDERPEGDSVAQGMRADATVLVHVSAGQEDVLAVSIPRDSWVPIPACDRGDGQYTNPRTGAKFNTAFALGGQMGSERHAAACAIRTVESLTNVPVDGYAIIDFDGFAHVVDALGGVTIELEESIQSPRAGNLSLEAGEQELDGNTALQYARARSGPGLSGSDIARIERQQHLMEAIVAEVKGQLRNVPALYRVANAVTSAVTASPNVGNLDRAASLLWGIREVSNEDITFTTVPVADRGDGANVLWVEHEAEILWEQMR